jgi:hypothetical protein
VIPPRQIGHATSYQLPAAAKLQQVAFMSDPSSSSGMDLRLDGPNGAPILQLQGLATNGIGVINNLAIPFKEGTIFYNNGDSVLLIFG